MFKKPFTTQNINITDGGYVNLIPAYNGQNQVLITQDLQHKTLDSTTTRIDDVIANGNLVQPAQLTPIGVIYVFNPQMNQQPYPQYVQNPQNFNGLNNGLIQPQHFQYQQVYPQPQTLQQQIAFEAAQRNGLEALLMQEQMRINQFQLEQARRKQLEEIHNQFQLRFHNDKLTSTSDLLNGSSQLQQSRGLPDFKNISGVIEQKLSEFTCDCDDPNNFTMGHTIKRRLNLTKSPDLKAQRKEIVVKEEHSEPKQKQVTYKETQECTTQTTGKNKTKGKCRKKKKVDSDDSEDGNRSPRRKGSKKAINKKDSAVTITTSTSESSDSEYSEAHKTKRKKSKKRRKCKRKQRR